MAAITESEKELLRLFRRRLNDVVLNDNLSPDYELVRWIRAREHKLDAAEKMLRNSLKWRWENNMDDILSWQPTLEYQRLYPYHVGTTRDNGIYILFMPGKFDYKASVASEESKQLFVKYIFRAWEEASARMKGRMNLDGIPVTQVDVIVDFKDYSVASGLPVLNLVKATLVQFDAHHPERLRRAFCVNTSKMLSIFLTLCKAVLAGKTFNKINVVDSDSIKSKEFFLDLISEEELPTIYGGKADTCLS